MSFNFYGVGTGDGLQKMFEGTKVMAGNQVLSEMGVRSNPLTSTQKAALRADEQTTLATPQDSGDTVTISARAAAQSRALTAAQNSGQDSSASLGTGDGTADSAQKQGTRVSGKKLKEIGEEEEEESSATGGVDEIQKQIEELQKQIQEAQQELQVAMSQATSDEGLAKVEAASQKLMQLQDQLQQLQSQLMEALKQSS